MSLDGLTDLQVARLMRLFDNLQEPGRSDAFNHFAFWTARELGREIAGRLLGIRLKHVLSFHPHEMKPGETIFLSRQAKEWRFEFGELTVGSLAAALDNVAAEIRVYGLGCLQQPPGAVC